MEGSGVITHPVARDSPLPTLNSQAICSWNVRSIKHRHKPCYIHCNHALPGILHNCATIGHNRTPSLGPQALFLTRALVSSAVIHSRRCIHRHIHNAERREVPLQLQGEALPLASCVIPSQKRLPFLTGQNRYSDLKQYTKAVTFELLALYHPGAFTLCRG